MDPIPGPVLDAMARFRDGTDDPRDRSTIEAYLASGRADPAVADALQQMLGAMGSGGNQGIFVIGDPRNPTTPTFPAQSPATLPPAGPPPTISGPTPVLPPPIQTVPGGHYPGINNTFTERVDTYNPPPDMTWTPPSLTPSPVSPMPTGGYGASNIQARAARQAARGDARGSVEMANGGGRTDWKGIEGAPAGSAFGDINRQYLQLYANSPDLAARELADQGLPAGQHAPNTAAAMAPEVGSALAMAKSGLLGGGGRGHGLGGPTSSRSQLDRAEALINSLGPGESIDPAYVYSRSLRRARKTPIDELSMDAQGNTSIGTQVQKTQDAILQPLKGTVDEDAYNATANMLQRAALAWLDGVAKGTINPDVTSYPQYLRDQKKQHYLGR